MSVVFVEKGQFDGLDGAFVMVDQPGVRTHLLAAGYAPAVAVGRTT